MTKYTPINPELFTQNRKNFEAKMLPNSLAIFNANDDMPRSADTTHPFRQNSDLFYLSGIDQEQTILVLFPNAPLPKYRQMLFLRRTDPVIAVWEGHKYTATEAAETSGIPIENIFWLDSFDRIIAELMFEVQYCYLNLNENLRTDTEVPDRDLRFVNSFKKRFPLHTFQRSAPILHRLRAIKHPIEIEQIQTAIDITEKAFRRLLKFVKPDVQEYEIEAEIMHEFLKNRASGVAYSSIIAAGKNACVLHYTANNQPCQNGDLLLMDFGAEYANYAADLTRTIPVNGVFTQRQKEVYTAVLDTLKFAKNLLVEGMNFEIYNQKIGDFVTQKLIDLKLLTAEEVKNQNPAQPAYKKYFMHGTSHYLGLDVHDVGHKYATFKAGMVFTCEPGIYIPTENIGIRLENDILINANGALPTDLMANIPIEIADIEALMKH